MARLGRRYAPSISIGVFSPHTVDAGTISLSSNLTITTAETRERTAVVAMSSHLTITTTPLRQRIGTIALSSRMTITTVPSALRNAKISLSARMVLTLRAKRLTPGYDWCRMADIEPGK